MISILVFPHYIALHSSLVKHIQRSTMGKTPLKREFIRDEKKRKLAFEQRKKSMLKKADELARLCDIKVGIIINGMNPDDETTVWNSGKPEDLENMVRLYKDQPVDQKKKRTTTSSIILQDEMRKSKSDLSKLQEVNNKVGYPMWDKSFDELSEEALREQVWILDAKIAEVNARYEFLKGNQLVCVNNLESHENVPLPLEYQSEFSASDFSLPPLNVPVPALEYQSNYPASNSNLLPLNEFDFPVSNFNLPPLNELNFWAPKYSLTNNNMTMTDLMNNGCSSDDYYVPQISDSSYYAGGNQFGYYPMLNNEAALICYNDPQQYYNAGAQSVDDVFLDRDFGAQI